MTTHPVLIRTARTPVRSRAHIHAYARAVALATVLATGLGPMGLWPALGVAQAAPVKKGGASVTMNFVNADIEGVARAMSAIIDRQIMVDPRVKGTVTLYSEQPLSPREAYLNFLSALRGQGFALVEVAGLLKVVPEADAKLQTGTVEVSNRPSRSGDQVLTQIFKLQFESANSLVTVLRPLISPNNTINANPSTNTLVITDYADNLKRLGQIIAAMDVPASTDMEAIALQYAVASDLAPVIQRFADGGGPAAGAGATGASVVMADARSNSLMVRSPNAARLAMIKKLVAQLDRPGASGLGGSGIHVVYLKNADAVKLAQVLRAAFPGGSGGGAASSSGAGTPAPTTPTSSNTAGATSSTASGASTQSSTPVAASAGPSTGGYIQADPSTNSLIITAPDALYRQLRTVIDQLDGRRAQVYIEAMIVEVSETKLAEAGIQWQTAIGNDGSSNVVGIGSNLPVGGVPSVATLSTSSNNNIAVPSGFNIGVVHKYANGAYGLSALATFLQRNADGNVLSKPNMIALDNEEAKIVVGQNVPFVTGQYTNNNSSSGSVNPFQTVERKDVGLTLRVKPQVGEGGTVRMTVFQENSSVDPASRSSPSGLTTNKSSIETTIVVDDGQTLVLGGLLKDSFNDNKLQVPGLGDIPLVGNLFKSRSRERAKTNLMVFLRPVVIRDQAASNAMTLDRYDYMQQRMADTKPEQSPLLTVNEAPQLPALNQGRGVAVPVQALPVPSQAPAAPQPIPAPAPSVDITAP